MDDKGRKKILFMKISPFNVLKINYDYCMIDRKTYNILILLSVPPFENKNYLFSVF
jgi:hypothetical protein